MGSKYEKFVFEFPAEYNEIAAEGDDFGYIVSPQAYFRGATQIPGSKYNAGFQIFVEPFFLDRVPHRHSEDEYLVFLGGTFPNLFDFEADIELTIGQLGVDAEVFHISKPTIVRIPANIHHCPINFKRIDKPVFFQAICMMPMFSGIYDMEEGQKELWYNGPLPCKLVPEKKCDSCRKCLESDL
jgi:mannose-6-phosphate isomerase-like protein (cupin superfamily)